MKKIIMLGLLTLAVNSYASNLLYCPDYIQCTRNDDPSSCQRIGGTIGRDLRFTGRVISGIYEFEKADGITSQYKYNSGEPLVFFMNCNYINTNKKISALATVSEPVGAMNQFGAYADNINGWKVRGWYATCTKTKLSTDCPFIHM